MKTCFLLFLSLVVTTAKFSLQLKPTIFITVNWLHSPTATLTCSSTHTHTITPLSNVVVIEVGTRGCTNRWAHMLLGRFIRLSRQHSGQACLDALMHCMCVCVCVYITPLYRAGEEQICLISFLITYGSSSIRTCHPQLPHPPTHLHT